MDQCNFTSRITSLDMAVPSPFLETIKDPGLGKSLQKLIASADFSFKLPKQIKPKIEVQSTQQRALLEDKKHDMQKIPVTAISRENEYMMQLL